MKYILMDKEEVFCEKLLFQKKEKEVLSHYKKQINNRNYAIDIYEWHTNYCSAIQIHFLKQSYITLTLEADAPFALLCYAGSQLTIASDADNLNYTLVARSNILAYGNRTEVSFLSKKKQIAEAFLLVISPEVLEWINLRNPIVYKIITREKSFCQCLNPAHFIFDTTLEADFIIKQIKGMDRSGGLYSFILETKARELLAINLQQQERNLCMSCSCFLHYRQQLHKAKELLELKYRNPPTIKQLAQEVGLCETILKTGFKSFFGTTVYNYLFDYRMRLAHEKLREKSFTINEVAEQSGYEHQSHFTTAFKRKYGISPGEYRKNAL